VSPKKDTFGFTLIELLVVIAIIGALASVMLPNFMAARERARDSQRKNDVKQIQKSLELYKLDQSLPSYPATLPDPGECWSTSGGAATCPAGEDIYMNRVPGDPKTVVPTPYHYTKDSELEYTLCTCLENQSDTDPDSSSGNCVAGTYTCPSGKKYVITQP
jgi:type II secretion system protein G